jgi:hypothetical protein
MMKFHNTKFHLTRKLQAFSQLLCGLLFFTFLPVQTLASPIPAMGSSALASASSGYLFNVKGFSLVSKSTNWRLQQTESAPNTSPKNSDISVRFQNPHSNGFLSVRTESLAQPTNIEFYAKRWIHDYAFYGFDILGAKEFSQGNARGYVIDLLHSKKNKQLRQVVFLKEKTAVVLTCTEDKNHFQAALGSCNSIVKTFRWL